MSMKQVSPRVCESQASVLFREHLHRVGSKELWSTFCTDMGVRATECDDGPWVALTPESPASSKTWRQVHAQFGTNEVEPMDPVAYVTP